LFDRILVPVDGSEHSERALAAAVQVAKRFSGKLTLMNVYSVTVTPLVMPEPTTSMPGVPMAPSADVSKLIDDAARVGRNILKAGEEVAKREGVDVESVLREGHVVEEIISIVGERGFDLIVLGARGMSHIRQLLLGSVTDGVIHHVKCPVLIVK
jgi:nucleotide-binding universal stress UspA family protein